MLQGKRREHSVKIQRSSQFAEFSRHLRELKTALSQGAEMKIFNNSFALAGIEPTTIGWHKCYFFGFKQLELVLK